MPSVHTTEGGTTSTFLHRTQHGSSAVRIESSTMLDCISWALHQWRHWEEEWIEQNSVQRPEREIPVENMTLVIKITGTTKRNDGRVVPRLACRLL